MPEHFISREDAENDLLACAAYLAESIQSNEGRAEAMLAVVPAYLDIGNVDLAAELSNTLDDPFVRDKLLVSVAEKCAAADDEEYALQLVEAMEEPAMQAQAREKIGLQLAGRGKTEDARSVAESMEHRDQVLAGIAVSLYRDGRTDDAAQTVAEISFPSAAVNALLNMAAVDIEKEDHPAAVVALDRALGHADDIEHEEERIRAFIDIGNSFTAAARNDRAIETLDKARVFAEQLDNVHRDAFLAQTSVGLMRAGSIDLADRILDAVADKTQIATALLGFSREYWRKDEREESLDALEEANAILRSQADKETRDSRARFVLLGNIAVQFAGFENGERAIDLAQDIEDETQSMESLSQIANILTFQKNDGLARTALAAIPEDSQRVFALIKMSDTLAAAGEKESAAALLDEAEALAEEVPQFLSRTSAYGGVSSRYHRLDELEKSRAVARKGLETVGSIRDERSRVAAVAELAGVYASNGFEVEEPEAETLRYILLQAV